jgi:hypothetical protein
MKTILGLSSALTFAVFALPAQAEDKVVHAVIDMSKPESAVEEISKLANDLSTTDRTVYLDLAIKPAIKGEKSVFPVERELASDGSSRRVNCESDWQRFSGASRKFVFDFNDVYHHFLFSVWHAGPLQAPFSTIACEYDSEAPGVAKFVVRGYFAKSSLSIPTAIEIELRPVSP